MGGTNNKRTPKVFILDCDGVFTDGGFYYTTEGKVMKRYGPDDSDAIKLLKRHMEVRAVSGDKRGFPITEARVARDMKLKLDLVSTTHRVNWIAERYSLDDVVYMGDGIFDPAVLSKVSYAISTSKSDPAAIAASDYVTAREGGRRAVAEACLHLMNKFFESFDAQTIVRDLID